MQTWRVGEVILNNLYAQTQLQTVFGINMVALDNGQPKLLNLKQTLEAFVLHRREVVTRRTVFELRKARERAHILEGLAISLANIDAVIELIRNAKNPAEAKVGLRERFWTLGHVGKWLKSTTAISVVQSGLKLVLHHRSRLSFDRTTSSSDLRLTLAQVNRP